jgi:hypothetical protein
MLANLEQELTKRNSLSGIQLAVTEESQAQSKWQFAVLEHILPAGYIQSPTKFLLPAFILASGVCDN